MNTIEKMRELVSELELLTTDQPISPIRVSKDHIMRYFGNAAWDGILNGTITDIGELYPYLNRKQFLNDI